MLDLGYHGGVHTHRCRHDPCVIDRKLVEHGDSVGHVSLEGVAAQGTVAGSAASRVVGDHGAALSEVLDLVTDDTRIDEVPGREEHNDSVASSVAVPGDPATVLTLDESLIAGNRPRDQHLRPPIDGVRLMMNRARCMGGVSVSCLAWSVHLSELPDRVTFPHTRPGECALAHWFHAAQGLRTETPCFATAPGERALAQAGAGRAWKSPANRRAERRASNVSALRADLACAEGGSLCGERRSEHRVPGDG